MVLRPDTWYPAGYQTQYPVLPNAKHLSISLNSGQMPILKVKIPKQSLGIQLNHRLQKGLAKYAFAVIHIISGRWKAVRTMVLILDGNSEHGVRVRA